MEICIAVADWARGPMTSTLGVPGGGSTGVRRRKRPAEQDRYRDHRVTPTSGSTARSSDCGRRAGMVAEWG
ncbi:hypothetical protein CW362_05700 [Streptomyces populi]|uniref:Uncharacterized protein n=2 Tax=Streptomyces TaxID=1883 RepID=A0A2I0SVC3_9ACTN|nr:hypothetical protein F8144_20120 [Streptomyces triticiradicis]PKT73850.1 hypothetical protein CW362_05700 [Streptomyces populi]